jgi:hypothetical protein
VPDEDAWKIREMYRRLAAGEAQKSVAGMVGLGVPTISVQKRNPLYAGFVWKHKERYEELKDLSYAHLRRLAEDPEVDWIYLGRHEPLVDPDTWDKVQRQGKRGQGPRGERLKSGLSGQIRCGYCGKVMHVKHKGGRTHTGLACDQCGWQKGINYLEDTVIAALVAVTSDKQFERDVDLLYAAEIAGEETDSPLAELRQQRGAAERKLKAATDFMLEFPELAHQWRETAVVEQERLRQLEQEIRELIAAEEDRPTVVAQWRAEHDCIKADGSIVRAWRNAPEADRRKLLREVFRLIEADKNGMRFYPWELKVEMSFQYPRVEKPGPGVPNLVAGPGLEPGTP